MRVLNEGGRYRRSAIALHWTMAALIFVLLPIGWTMTVFEDDPRSKALVAIHMSLGLVALGLVVTRIVWRSRCGAPAFSVTQPAWQRFAAGASHLLLYVLMLGVPVIGLLAASFGTDGVVFFGWSVPRLTLVEDAMRESLFSLHGVLAATLAALAALHVAAALKHLFVDRDGVFERMSIRHRSIEREQTWPI